MYQIAAYIWGWGYARVEANATVGIVVTHVDVSEGGFYGGTTVTVRGSGFSPVHAFNRVKVGGDDWEWLNDKVKG